MAVRFVTGRSGTGKTAHCVRAIVEAATADPLGPPIFWILPRQATFSAERLLATETTLPAVCRVRVESFDGLARAILNDCGGAAIPQITATGRRIILSHLLRKLQPQLKFFAAVAHHPGLATTLDATFAEFERSGNAPQQVIETLEAQADAVETDDTLRPKLADLHLLYEAYTTFLGQDRLDPHRRNEQVVACMKTSKLLSGSIVFIDGFFDYTESERRTIAGLAATCRSIDITVLADPGATVFKSPDLLPSEQSLFYKTEDAYRRLFIALRKNGAKIDKPIMLREVHRFSAPALTAIEAATFTGDVAKAPDDAGVATTVTFTNADDRPAEVDAAARHVLSLLRQGHRMRDIAVLVRNLDSYQDLIDASFREHGIAFFLDRRRVAAHHPLLRLVRSALELATDDWPRPAIFSLVKTGLAGLSLAEADALENYVHDHRIRASDWTAKDPWRFRRSLTRGDDDDALWAATERAAQADALRRRVVDAVLPFIAAMNTGASRPAPELALELHALLTRFDVAKTLSTWINEAAARQAVEQAAEHQQVWAEFVGLLDELVDLLGDQPVSAAEFFDLMATSLDAFDLALAPPTLDGVLIGQVDRTRLPEVRTTLVLGLTDGEFPRTPREDSILDDRDRKLLRQGNVELKGDGQRQLLDERLLAYSAFTSPSQSLYLSRVACDAAGKEIAPSPYWSRLQQVFPDAPVEHVGSSDSDDPRHIATPRQLIVSLMRWARATDNATDEADTAKRASLAALYQWLASHPPDDSPVAHMRYRAWGALGYRNATTLDPQIAAQLFPSPIVASVNRLETFAACPFKHFVQYGLGLRARPEDSFSSIDLSRVYHDVLERFVRQMIRANQQWRDLTQDWTDGRIGAAAREIGLELQKDLAIEPGRSKYLLSRIERTVRQIVGRQRTLSSRAKLSHGYVSVAFGTPDAPIGPLQLSTPAGRQLHVRGRIDRIDLLGDASRAAVFDYKLTGDRISPAGVYNGLSLQLLTYLLVLQANGHELAGTPITPAAGFYLTLLRGLKSVAHPDEAPDPTDEKFNLDPKPRGLFDADHVHLLDEHLAAGWSDAWSMYVTKDGKFGQRETTDVCDADEFLGVLDYVRGKLASIADGMAAGEIGVRPYWLAKKTPCAQCGFKAVCRFDVTLNGYNILHGIGRDELLTKVKGTK
ncbi:MAG TPA: PD-(D/E)XK nuclease family protein [Tepidisphaeraceae bacterium]|jgi:ATP-dependent helicase/nuclease subunit B|nr:PD-(D/E)XK nuclease family protein [Tepidisphaeraceae bacterium]